LSEKIPQWTGGLHDWQITIVASIFEGEDVLCVTATGDGKSALFAVPMIVLMEVARNPTACPGIANHKKPVALVIAPTRALPQISCVILIYPYASMIDNDAYLGV
jgi:ATP-dependent helicase YprA (DUF1998 family)